jgi:ATP-dependent DNA helicase DinG
MSAEVESGSGIMGHFVLAEPRAKQVTALEYVARKYAEGFRHIVIAAPTGTGKSGMGATVAFWSQDIMVDSEKFDSGAYLLVHQKLLQDQYSHDFPKYVAGKSERCASLKSSTEYLCENFGCCAFGLNRQTICACAISGECSYRLARRQWMRATLSVTNYSYLFTEHWAAKQLRPRKVLILDEAHGLERGILKFIEVVVSQDSLRRWTPTIKCVPDFSDAMDFAQFLIKEYLPILNKRLESMSGYEAADDSPQSQAMAREKVDLENHYGQSLRAANLIINDPDNWVFWQEMNNENEMQAMAKPLDAAPFSKDLLFDMGHVCIHMSAYPGSKRIYCQNLGLDEEQVAWLNLNSTFPLKNRPIFVTPLGSMSRRNRDGTLPHLLSFIEELFLAYPNDKGLIHVVSYELGQMIAKRLAGTPHARRVLFPKSADAREDAFKRHKTSSQPTVLISPSMTEGFDFIGDFARWQALCKVPFPYLGDRQVSAKKDRDQEWYDLQAVMSTIQALGRVCRSEEDWGHSYLLDSDFVGLFDKCRHMFPKWLTEAFVWPKRLERPEM